MNKNKRQQTEFPFMQDAVQTSEEMTNAKSVEEKKRRIADYFHGRSVEVDKPLKVGTEEERGERSPHFHLQYPDDNKIQGYRYLTDAKELGPLVMILRNGQEIFYCPEGIDQRTGSAKVIRIDASIEEFTRVWENG